MVHITCEICFVDIQIDQIEEHEKTCYDQQVKLLKELEDNKEPEQIKLELTITQTKALQFCQKKSNIYSKNVKPNLFAKMMKMGYSKDDFYKTIKFVKKNVPVVVHIHLDRVIDFIINDEYLRNRFESNTSSGSLDISSRSLWEDKLFNSIYKDSEGPERVKYGAVNINCDPCGVRAASSYGDSYLYMKDDVKMRTSFVYGDSSMQDYHISTFRNFLNILYYIPDNWLIDVVNSATHKVDQPNKQLPHMPYIEAQIHGSVRFDRDVELLVVSDKYMNDDIMIQKLKQFEANHYVPWIFMSDLAKDIN